MLRAREAYDAKMRSVVRFDPTIENVPLGLIAQPLNDVQWVHSSRLRANAYNPNVVAPPELKLLKVSLLSDGWTQPIVVRASHEETNGLEHVYEIVDGFHRWLLVKDDPHVSKMTDGMVPIVVVLPRRLEDQMMSTIRHNRARGTHHVLAMADIVAELSDRGAADDRIGQLLGMDPEEIERMRDRGNMVKRGSAEEFGKGWQPT
jgi:ParB-like chromosome segregation protein Spo0J